MEIQQIKEKLKVGDWIRINDINNSSKTENWIEGEIGEITENKIYVWQNKNDGGIGNLEPSTKKYKYSWVISLENPNEIEIINPKKNKIMNKLNVIAQKILSKDTRSLIKANYLNNELELTEEGKNNLIAILFEKNKEALIKLAEEKIKEEKM